MTKKTVRVGLLGCGTVGSGVVLLLQRRREALARLVGAPLEITRIAVRDPGRARVSSVDADRLTTDAFQVVRDHNVDVIVEVVGGVEPARQWLLEAIASGKQVVTANKALLASHGSEIYEAARARGISVGFEASVAGGVPVIQTLREGLVANRIESLYGIINGTSNYILTEMSRRGSPFAEVLKQAQQAGYAEADPTFDVDGIDTAHKLAVLAGLAFGQEVKPEQIPCEGIRQITPQDIDFARQLGFVIKLLAIGRQSGEGIETRVHASLLPKTHLLADVSGANNSVYVKGDAVGDIMLSGPGAGMMPTASAVVSDIVRAARVALGKDEAVLPGPLSPAKLKALESVNTEYYLRFTVVDRPGMLGEIARILGAEGISIASVYQPDRNEGGQVPVVIMTHEAREAHVQKALRVINKLDGMAKPAVVIRVTR